MARAAFALWLAAAACGRIGFGDRANDATVAPDDGSASQPSGDDAAIQAPMFVQHIASQDDDQQVAAAMFVLPVSAGDLIVAGIDFGYTGQPQSLTSVTDSLGDTYTITGPFDGSIDGANPARLYIAYAFAIASGSVTVQATLDSASTGFYELRLHEYAHVAAADPFDTTIGSAGAGTGSDGAAASIVTSEPNELIFAMVIDGTVTQGTGFSLRGGDFNDLTEDRIAPTAGSYDVLATPTQNWVLAAAAIRGR